MMSFVVSKIQQTPYNPHNLKPTYIVQNWSEALVMSGTIMTCYIVLRLIMLRRFDFINILNIFAFSCEIIFGLPMNFFFFNVYHNNIELNGAVDSGFDCKFYITLWMIYWIVIPFTHLGLNFTRYIYIRYSNQMIKTKKEIY